ncbi:MAG: hypothetical protein OXC07_00090 [Kistimonas sp.]|nr:hypothetical protein [Kistimonas sp.]
MSLWRNVESLVAWRRIDCHKTTSCKPIIDLVLDALEASGLGFVRGTGSTKPALHEWKTTQLLDIFSSKVAELGGCGVRERHEQW